MESHGRSIRDFVLCSGSCCKGSTLHAEPTRLSHSKAEKFISNWAHAFTQGPMSGKNPTSSPLPSGLIIPGPHRTQTMGKEGTAFSGVQEPRRKVTVSLSRHSYTRLLLPKPTGTGCFMGSLVHTGTLQEKEKSILFPAVSNGTKGLTNLARCNPKLGREKEDEAKREKQRRRPRCVQGRAKGPSQEELSWSLSRRNFSQEEPQQQDAPGRAWT